jgi:hypothetical protein
MEKMDQSLLFLSRRGREASIEYEPCWPGKGFLPHCTGLYIVHFLSPIYTAAFRVGHPARVDCTERHNVYFRRKISPTVMIIIDNMITEQVRLYNAGGRQVYHRLRRAAMATFYGTFHIEGKISQGW